MFKDFKFALCHHKTKKRSTIFRNLDLDNQLKIVAPREYTYYEKDSYKTRYSSLPPLRQNENLQQILANRKLSERSQKEHGFSIKSNSFDLTPEYIDAKSKCPKSKSMYFKHLPTTTTSKLHQKDQEQVREPLLETKSKKHLQLHTYQNLPPHLTSNPRLSYMNMDEIKSNKKYLFNNQDEEEEETNADSDL